MPPNHGNHATARRDSIHFPAGDFMHASPSTLTTGIPWVDELILWTLVVGVLGGALIKIIRWIVPFTRRADEVFSTILGSVREGRRSLDDRLDAIEHELFPNSGGSLRDAVDRTEAHVKDIERQGARTEEKIDDHIGQSALIMQRGRQTEQDIRNTIATLADAVKIAAQSTPPEHEEHS